MPLISRNVRSLQELLRIRDLLERNQQLPRDIRYRIRKDRNGKSYVSRR